MEQRRLQKTGGSSLTVTLPKQWVGQHKLHEKDVVTISNQISGALLIKTVSAQAVTPTKLDIHDMTLYMITREAVALYIAGVDEVQFVNTPITQQQRSHIRRVLHMVMGFEIVDETANALLIRNILDVAKLTIPNTIDNLFTVARSMLSDSVHAVIDNQAGMARDIADRDLEVDKMYLMIKRQFHSVLDDRISEEDINLNRSDLNYYRTIALQFERIADHAVKIAQTIPSRAAAIPEISKDTYSNLVTQILVIMDAIKGILHEPNLRVAHNILDKNNELESVIENLRFEPKADATSRVILDDSLDRVRGYLMNTAEAVVDRAVRRRIVEL